MKVIPWKKNVSKKKKNARNQKNGVGKQKKNT